MAISAKMAGAGANSEVASGRLGLSVLILYRIEVFPQPNDLFSPKSGHSSGGRALANAHTYDSLITVR